MKIFLDDCRPTPVGYTRCYWPDEVVALLKTGCVRELSLDHDLGDDSHGTGYDVLLWIEEAVHAGKMYIVPKMYVHSSNTSAKMKMLAAIEQINKLSETAL